ncbi:MAG TPA: MOSC domain-containing protein [Candidatus Limnocylindrales bacterium]
MRVSAIHTYPIKGCRRIDHDTAVVEPWGIEHDRRWLVTDPDGVAITQREVASLGQLRAVPGQDGISLSFSGQTLWVPIEANPIAKGDVFGAVVAATPAGPVADAWLSAALGADARLVWLDDPGRRRIDPQLGEPESATVSFADEAPLLLATTASLARLNDWIAEGEQRDEGPLPMERFRPNVVVDGSAPFEEDAWVGGVIRIGELEFRVLQACGRCVVTTTDQATGVRGKEPLRTLGRHRNVNQKLLFGVHLSPVTAGRISVGDEVTVPSGALVD